MDNVPPLDAVTFSVTRYNLWVACRLQSIGDMLKAEMEHNRLFREEMRHRLATLQAEVERLRSGGTSSTICANSNHSDDPRFDVSARISDMLGSTSASLTEALLESDSQTASLLAPYGLIPPARVPISCLGLQSSARSQAAPDRASPAANRMLTRANTVSAPGLPIIPGKQEPQFNEVVVGGEEEDEDEEDDDEVDNHPGPQIKEESMDSNEFIAAMNSVTGGGTNWQNSDNPKDTEKVINKKACRELKPSAAVTRVTKTNYMENEWKKRRARELASARMRRFRERQRLKKAMIQSFRQ